jgi:hypothetical protein
LSDFATADFDGGCSWKPSCPLQSPSPPTTQSEEVCTGVLTGALTRVWYTGLEYRIDHSGSFGLWGSLSFPVVSSVPSVQQNAYSRGYANYAVIAQTRLCVGGNGERNVCWQVWVMGYLGDGSFG